MKNIFRKNFFKGFTLVELMIVIAIIGILATVLYPSVTGYFARARDTKKKMEINHLALSLTTYYTDNATYKIDGTGHYGGGQGWINFKNGITYKKTLSEGLEEGGYLKKGYVRIMENNTIFFEDAKNYPCATKSGLDIINHETSKSKTHLSGKNLYMYYYNNELGRYSLTAYLEVSSTQKDKENVLNNLLNGSGANGTCSRYGRNYGIGN